MAAGSNTDYALADPDAEKGEGDGFLDVPFSPSTQWAPQGRQSHWQRPLLFFYLPWFLSAIFACSTLFLLVRLPNKAGPSPLSGTYEAGFATDFILPSSIPEERVRFTGSPDWYLNGTEWVKPVDAAAPWPENTRYFGEPGPEVDEAWERLVGDRYFSISEEEAETAWGDRYRDFIDQKFGGFTGGFDMFHNLHCLNSIRRSLYPDYYPPEPLHGPLHRDHCLDAIRQSIQCYGSTTLIPTRFREGLQRMYIDSNQEHTCRSFNFLHRYTKWRAAGHGGYVERDESLVDPQLHKIAVNWEDPKTDGHN